MRKPYIFYLLLMVISFQLTGQPVLKRKATLWSADWSDDGLYIAIGGDDSVLTILTGVGFRLYRSYPLNTGVKVLAWNPDGNLLAIGTGMDIRLLNISSGEFKVLTGKHGARGIDWDATGELLAVGGDDGVIFVWNKRGELKHAIKKDNNNTYLTLDWHPSKKLLITGSDEIRIFDVLHEKEIRFINHRKEHTGILTAQWHPSGDFFASGDYGHQGEGVPTLLQFWEEDGTPIKTMQGSMAEYRNIRWNKEGTLLATASDALRIWSPQGKLLYTGPSDPHDWLWGIDWSSDGSLVITTSGRGNIKVWNKEAVLLREIN